VISGSLHRLAVIVGPTAVGKSALALDLCDRFDAEIISADSRQVYRGLDIGTAKPTSWEQSRVPHHLIDVIGPGEQLSVAEYQGLAYRAIADVQARRRLPLLVGGTGQYVRAVVEGWSIPRVPPRPELRRQLQQEAESQGYEALHVRLAELDPAAAERIDPRNVRRVIRALEVCQATGKPLSELQEKHPPPYHILQIGLTMERQALYERADRRIADMLEGGLIEEVGRLLRQGYDLWLSSMSGIGYAEVGCYLRGEITLEEAVRRMRANTRRFIRHQYSWFRLADPHIRWIQQGAQVLQEAVAVLGAWLMQRSSGD
jgi:tRNA dimethylallyltransferase